VLKRLRAFDIFLLQTAFAGRSGVAATANEFFCALGVLRGVHAALK